MILVSREATLLEQAAQNYAQNFGFTSIVSCFRVAKFARFIFCKSRRLFLEMKLNRNTVGIPLLFSSPSIETNERVFSQ